MLPLAVRKLTRRSLEFGEALAQLSQPRLRRGISHKVVLFVRVVPKVKILFAFEIRPIEVFPVLANQGFRGRDEIGALDGGVFFKEFRPPPGPLGGNRFTGQKFVPPQEILSLPAAPWPNAVSIPRTARWPAPANAHAASRKSGANTCPPYGR